MNSEYALGVVRHYRSLLREAFITRSGHAADWVGRLVLWVTVAATIALGVIGVSGSEIALPASVLAVLLTIVLVLELLIVEYDRYRALDARVNEYRRKEIDELKGTLREIENEVAMGALFDSLRVATKDLAPQLWGDHPDVTALMSKVDLWDGNTVRVLEKHHQAEVSFFTRRVEVADAVNDPIERLRGFVGVKIDRLMEITRRQIDERYRRGSGRRPAA